MKRLLKVCTKCKISKDFSDFSKEKKGLFGLKSSCKLCNNQKTTLWKKSNIEKVKNLDVKYKRNQPEKIKIAKEKWRNKPASKVKIANLGILATQTLSDGYVTKKLRQQGFDSLQISQNEELVEIKRLIIKTKRLCRALQN
jgi:hypothetical protein